jgi:peptidoglycan hydrolase CwlO-like protein
MEDRDMRINKNGNGEVVLTMSKLMLAVLSFLLLLVGSVFTSAISYGRLQNEVGNTVNDVSELETEVNDLENRVDENDVTVGVISSQLDTVISKLENIDQNIKELHGYS